MAVYVAFSDESASGDEENGLFILGGYVASFEHWPCVVEAWQKHVLDAHPCIPYLHMNEIRRKKFQAKWRLSETQAADKVKTAISILTDSDGLLPILSLIEQRGFKRLRTELRARNIPRLVDTRDPDYVAYVTYVTTVLLEVRAQFTDAQEVRFMISKKPKVTDNIIGSEKTPGFHERLASELSASHPALAGLLGVVNRVDALQEPAAQAADLLCWHFHNPCKDEDHRRILFGGPRRLQWEYVNFASNRG
jgi:hypothetical protein